MWKRKLPLYGYHKNKNKNEQLIPKKEEFSGQKTHIKEQMED